MLGAIKRRWQASAPRLPQLPPGWPDEVLVPLARIDVERWRRFTGTIVHRSEHGGDRLELELRRGGAYEPGTLRRWWRSDSPADTVPELHGELRITPLRAIADGAATGPTRDGAAHRKIHVGVELEHTRAGRNEATLELLQWGGWLRSDRLRMEAAVPAPGSELSVDPGAVVDAASGWQGLPAPLSRSDVRPELPLSVLTGATVFLNGSHDLHDETPELLLCGAAPDGTEFLVRVRAAGAMKWDAPNFDDGSWNTAGALDMDYVVEQHSLSSTALWLRGPEWEYTVTGEQLEARAERLAAGTLGV